MSTDIYSNCFDALMAGYVYSGFAGHVTDPGRRFYCIGKVSLLEPQRHVDQANEHGYLYQRANDGGEGLARVDTKDSDCHSDSELKIV